MEIEKYSPKWLLEKINNSKNDAHKLMHIIEYSKEIIKSTDQQLILTDVSSMFSEKQMEEAWTDGCGCGESRSGYFDIENYR